VIDKTSKTDLMACHEKVYPIFEVAKNFLELKVFYLENRREVH
jgi:hypothetical protein